MSCRCWFWMNFEFFLENISDFLHTSFNFCSLLNFKFIKKWYGNNLQIFKIHSVKSMFVFFKWSQSNEKFSNSNRLKLSFRDFLNFIKILIYKKHSIFLSKLLISFDVVEIYEIFSFDFMLLVFRGL